MQEINTIEAFRQWIKKGARPVAAVQGLDLRRYTRSLGATNLTGSFFLSCHLSPTAQVNITANGGLVLPDNPNFSFKTHKSHLYSVEELFEGYDHSDPDGYYKCFDQTVYKEFVIDGPDDPPLHTGLYRQLHDHSISDALNDLIRDEKIVAMMGGHSMERGDPYYRDIALISRELTRSGFMMASGGGPGAMEATHLGAYFAQRPISDLEEAIEFIRVRPEGGEAGKEYKDRDWFYRAWEVMQRYPLTAEMAAKSRSIGIPTWFYGHEPPSCFATHIAKYFANSIREDSLLLIAKHGVIFAPGSAGTRQEIFQDAAQNHYGSGGHYSPMILLGTDYWRGMSDHEYSYNVWELLETSASQNYRSLLELTDDRESIIRSIKSYDPEAHRS